MRERFVDDPGPMPSWEREMWEERFQRGRQEPETGVEVAPSEEPTTFAEGMAELKRVREETETRIRHEEHLPPDMEV